MSISKLTKDLLCCVSLYPALYFFRISRQSGWLEVFYLDFAPIYAHDNFSLHYCFSSGIVCLLTHLNPLWSVKSGVLVTYFLCLVKHVNLGNTVVRLFNLVLLVGFLNPLDYHTDVWSPFHFVSNKIWYFVTFVDDYSQMTWLFLMKTHYYCPF